MWSHFKPTADDVINSPTMTHARLCLWHAVLYNRPFFISLVKWAATRQRMDMYSYVMVNEGNERSLLECWCCFHFTKSIKWKRILPVESTNEVWIQ